jgi:hypothetical protein
VLRLVMPRRIVNLTGWTGARGATAASRNKSDLVALHHGEIFFFDGRKKCEVGFRNKTYGAPAEMQEMDSVDG